MWVHLEDYISKKASTPTLGHLQFLCNPPSLHQKKKLRVLLLCLFVLSRANNELWSLSILLLWGSWPYIEKKTVNWVQLQQSFSCGLCFSSSTKLLTFFFNTVKSVLNKKKIVFYIIFLKTATTSDWWVLRISFRIVNVVFVKIDGNEGEEEEYSLW